MQPGTMRGRRIAVCTYAITAYAVGVIIGSPLITLACAQLNRRIATA